MQIKVNDTRMHKVLHEEVPVAEAKLVLLPGGDKMSTKAVRLFKQEGPEWFTPILISETEKIEVQDWVYDLNLKEIYMQAINMAFTDKVKVLAMPEHFSPKHLQAIVDGKMKDGCKVLVECEVYGGRLESIGKSETWKQIKLNDQGHITLYHHEGKTAEDYREDITRAIKGCEDYDYRWDGENETRVDTFDTDAAIEAVMEIIDEVIKSK